MIRATPGEGPFDREATLEIDERRFEEIAEGWIPVKSLFGEAVLVFNNCD